MVKEVTRKWSWHLWKKKTSYKFIATKKSNIQGLSLWCNDCPFERKTKGLERYDNNIQYCIYIYIYIYINIYGSINKHKNEYSKGVGTDKGKNKISKKHIVWTEITD